MYLENEANQCSLCIVLSIHALLLRCWLFGLEGMQVIQLSSQVDHVLSLINGLCFLFKSGHPPHVHLSWPLSVLCTKLRLCTKDCLKEAFSQFMQRLQMCHCPDLMTDQLTEAFHEFNLKFYHKRIQMAGTRSILWMVLPWHPGFSDSGIVGGFARLSEGTCVKVCLW
jgi:hypothetical protein